MGWEFLKARWWSRLRSSERRLIFWSLCVGLPLTSIAMTKPYKIPGSIYLGPASLIVAMGAVLYSLRPQASVEKHLSAQGWESRIETAPGFPVVTWFQEVDTGRQQKHARANLELNLILGVLVAGAAIGFMLGGPEGAFLGFLFACYVAPGASRTSTPPKLESVGGYVPMPSRWGERQLTEVERQIDNEPITETWQGQALITHVGGADLIEGEPIFEVRWRNTETNEVRLLCHRPWTSLSAFEMDSYGKLFVGRVAPLSYHDPWVITVRIDGQNLLELARDMSGQARLQYVFSQLSRQFGIERRNDFMRERAAERKKRGLDRPPSPASDSSPSEPRKKPKL